MVFTSILKIIFTFSIPIVNSYRSIYIGVFNGLTYQDCNPFAITHAPQCKGEVFYPFKYQKNIAGDIPETQASLQTASFLRKRQPITSC